VLAAGLPTIFQRRCRDIATGSANATPRGNEAALHGWTGRRVGRGAHILTGDLLRITEGGPLRVTGRQKPGRKMHGSMHVSGTSSW
jgi:hypothetical protein